MDDDEIDRNFCWFRIDTNHMTEPWLDQALMDSAYRSGKETLSVISIDLHAEMSMPDSKLFPLKLFLIKNYILMFLILKTNYFFAFFTKMTCSLLLQKHMTNDKIFYIFDQIKVSRVPLWVGHYHLFMKGLLKLRLQSL